ncbi:hypothetical protein SBA4_4590057 [Candidatus Sulfopaludibacter sp. SbA4]|nr:hypothetical protein SBA4_4590057 [Candidatus Sulfopaludibacter sp. SbA4]
MTGGAVDAEHRFAPRNDLGRGQLARLLRKIRTPSSTAAPASRSAPSGRPGAGLLLRLRPNQARSGHGDCADSYCYCLNHPSLPLYPSLKQASQFVLPDCKTSLSGLSPVMIPHHDGDRGLPRAPPRHRIRSQGRYGPRSST